MRVSADTFEDMEQEAELARLEAERMGFDPEAAAARVRAEWRRAEMDRAYRERPARIRLEWLPEARKVVGKIPAPKRTQGQRHKAFRDQLILIGSLAGMSERDLATAMDLPHSRIHAILVKMRDKAGVA